MGSRPQGDVFRLKRHSLRPRTLGAASLDLDRRMVDTKVLTHRLGYAGQKRVRTGVRHDEVDGQCRIGGADSPDVQIVHDGDAPRRGVKQYLVLVVAGLAMAAILIAESLFLGRRAPDAHSGSAHDHHHHG